MHQRAFVVGVAAVLLVSGCSESGKQAPSAGKSASSLYWTPTATGMGAARYQHIAETLFADAGAPVLVSGGAGTVGGTSLSSAELFFSGTGEWQPAAQMAEGRARHASVLLSDGTVLVMSGWTGSTLTRNAERYRYSADGGSWSQAGSLINARSDHTATLLQDGRVLVTGGVNLSSLPIAAAETWSSGNNLWVTTLPMSHARAGHAATLLPDGRVLVTGGDDGTSVLTSAELYSPGLSSWAAAGSMSVARKHHTATVIHSGTKDYVLVTGGLDSAGGSLKSAELYDIALNSWTTVAPMAEARADHTANLVSGGRVVVSGGVASNSYLSSAEVFDPPSASDPAGKWSPTGCMADARADHTSSLLGSGKVLVAGGRNPSVLASAEIHDLSGGLPNGAFCSRGCECASQFCADGVCCNSACNGSCEACNLTGSVGSCSPVDAGSPGDPVCAPYLCDGAQSSCPASCDSDDDCVASHRCVNSQCVPRSPDGTACSADTDCANRHCVDGLCCNSSCDGSCESCNQSGKEGSCSAVPLGTPGSPSCSPFACDGTGASCPTTCTVSEGCDGEHRCVQGACLPRLPKGDQCGSDSDCLGGFCTDGVCCDSRCGDSCDACNLQGSVGTCTVLEKGAAGETSCSPYVCGGDSAKCPTSCEKTSDCAAGARCIDQQCSIKPAGYIGWSWNCSIAGNSAGLWGLLAVVIFLRGRRRIVSQLGLGARSHLARTPWAFRRPASHGPFASRAIGSAWRSLRSAAIVLVLFLSGAARAQSLATDPGLPASDAPTRVSDVGSGGFPQALAGLHFGGTVLADFVSEQAGGELYGSYTVLPFLHLGVAGTLGDNIGLRAVGLLHPGPIGDSPWEPFLQLRGLFHPVPHGAGWGGGAWVGLSYAVGPGRIRGGLLGEAYSGPSNYYPYAIVGALGYEVDPFKSRVEVTERVVEKFSPTRFRGKLTDLDDHPIKGKITLRRAPGPRQGQVLIAAPSAELELEPGEYELVAEAEGYLSRGRTFTINRGDTVVSDFALRPVPGQKTAQLTDERIEILQSIQFEFDKATILQPSFVTLDEVVDIMLQHPELKVRIEGHTDEIGSADYNDHLSQARAESVWKYLVDKGVAPKRLTAKGYGFSKPIAPNSTDEGRAKNRRVQFEIVR